MKRHKLFTILAMLCLGGGSATAGGNYPSSIDPEGFQPVSAESSSLETVCCENDVTCGCETSCDCGPGVEAGCGCETPGCDGACELVPYEASCDGGCDSACGDRLTLPDLFKCDIGEPFVLFGENCGWSAGGWVQMGYHNHALPLFNSRPDNFQLHQAWFWAEKAIDATYGFDIGGRIDYVYGTDGPDTQAFGINNGHWDENWDNGGDYGHALPQVYVEAGYGDLSVKAGHFYTIIGWEVVTAPDNFFYSHAYTMYNSEPFTHTGTLATYSINEDLEVYGGYVFGWDSGFEDNGDAFLGGASLALCQDISLTYATVAGRFADGPTGTSSQGYMHSIVADVAVTDSLQYIFQSDYLDTEDSASNGVANTFGINQYLIYSLSDCVAAGARFEWYNQEGIYSGFGTETDIYALTLGVNVKPHANLIVRPEIRFDWDEDQVAGLDEGDDQTTFGIDTILLF